MLGGDRESAVLDVYLDIFLTESGEIEEETIQHLEELIREKSGCKEVHHTYAGCTVSSHCGPRCLGVLFIEE